MNNVPSQGYHESCPESSESTIPKVLNLLVWGCIVIIIILAVGKSVKAP